MFLRLPYREHDCKMSREWSRSRRLVDSTDTIHGKWLLRHHMCISFSLWCGRPLCTAHVCTAVACLNFIFIKKRKKGFPTSTWNPGPREMGLPSSECRPPVDMVISDAAAFEAVWTFFHSNALCTISLLRYSNISIFFCFVSIGSTRTSDLSDLNHVNSAVCAQVRRSESTSDGSFICSCCLPRLVADFCYGGIPQLELAIGGKRHKVVFLGLAMKFVINMLFVTIC
jgi:hypothetical protein